MSASKRRQKGLITLTQIKLWEREYSILGRDVQRIEARRTAIKSMIDGARSLAPTESAAAEQPRPKRKYKRRKVAKVASVVPTPMARTETPRAVKRKRGKASQWRKELETIVTGAGHPVPYAEAKEAILKSPLADRFRQSDKGFYHAISRMHHEGSLVSYKAHLFTPAAFASFQEQLKAGVIRDLKAPNAAHKSPMGDAIREMMRGRPNGAESGHIIWELRKTPEFAETIEKNKTHPYNVLARLVTLGDLVKRGKRYYAPGAKTEAPSDDKSEGASKITGEADTSSIESRKGSLFG
jgi:hypothetical protein